MWDKQQKVSTSNSTTFKFPHKLKCPAKFHVKVSWIKWGYTSPGGPSVRLKWLKLRLKPNHRMRVTIDGRNRWFPAKKFTTRHYAVDTSKNIPLLKWDGSKAVGVFIGNGQNTSTYYAPKNFKVAGGCKQPTHLAGLKRHF